MSYFVHNGKFLSFKGKLLSNVSGDIIITLPPIYLISFGETSNTSETVSGVTWNRFSGHLSGSTINNIVESSASALSSDIKITLLSGFTGKTSTGAVTNNDSGLYPDSRILNNLFAGSVLNPIVEISGLTNGKTYNIIMFGSSTASSNICNYTIGSTTVSLQVRNNMFNTVNIDNVSPINGRILISLTPTSSQNTFLGVLKIIENNLVDIGSYEFNGNIDPQT